MASGSARDLSCPICFDIFEEPVVLTCSHSFCKGCVNSWWRGKIIKECPVCKYRPLSEPPVSLALKNVCETYVKARRLSDTSEMCCALHQEKLKLFCLDHQEPVCLICRDSRAHSNHQFRPVNEAALDYRAELQRRLQPLEEKQEHLQELLGNWEKSARHIKVQSRNLEKEIRDQFEKLHQFLRKEEEARVSEVKEEEKRKSNVMREKIDSLSSMVAANTDAMAAVEEELRSSDIAFLQNCKALIKKVDQRSRSGSPEPLYGTLMDEVKHVGNLSFKIWNKMKEVVSYSPVVLDPNSAHPELVLSHGLTSVRRDVRQKLPDNPERFDCCRFVLGSEGFSSGSHSWEVEVAGNMDWAVGVAAKQVQRKGEVTAGLWRLRQTEDVCTAVSPSDFRVLSSRLKPLGRIRVDLDCERGKVSFYDADTDTNIFTFSYNCTDMLFPYFHTKKDRQLKIVPRKVSATLK